MIAAFRLEQYPVAKLGRQQMRIGARTDDQLVEVQRLARRQAKPHRLSVAGLDPAHLIGKHDFTTFRSAHCQSESPIKTLDRLDVVRMGERIEVHAEARSFLHHQVRSMVGCLALVGIGTWEVADMAAALAAKDRSALGLNAPPDGLYFVEARY